MTLSTRRFSFRILSTVALTAVMAGGLWLAAEGRANAADKLSEGQKTEIQALIKEYLVKNPEVVIEALTAYQNKEQADAGKAFKEKYSQHKDFLTSSSAPFAGNPKGKVTVVEFFDYNCGYCHRAVEDVTKLIEADKDVKVIFHDYPILSESSGEASRYALASQKQDKYFEFHQKLMKYSGQKNEDAYKKIATELGLDFDKLKKDADSKEVREALEKNTEVARDLGINGTPAFIFNDNLVPGYIGVDDMKRMVENQRKK